MASVYPSSNPKTLFAPWSEPGFSFTTYWLPSYPQAPDRPIPRVTVAYHKRNLKLASIIEQSGLTVEEFIELL